MPERCESRCPTVTAPSMSGRSRPRTERAVVVIASVPSSIKLATASAVSPLDPLAIAKRVSTVFAIPLARSASPYALANAGPPPRSTRTTPANRSRSAMASIASLSDGMQALRARLQMLLQARHQLDQVAWPVAAVELPFENIIPTVAAGAGRAGEGEEIGAAGHAPGGPALDGR